MITVNKANPTQGEITSSLTGSTGDGAGLNLDGSAGAISLGSSMPDLGSKYSLEFVVKGDARTGEVYLLDAYNSSSTNRVILAWSGNSNGNIQLHVNGTWSSAFMATPDNGDVVHLLLSVDGTSATLYQNGNAVSTQTVVANTMASATSTHIGSSQNGTGNFFNGTIYRARFYNRTLSADDVRTVFERADVDYSSQYGSETDLVNANSSGSGTAWTGASGVTPPNGWSAAGSSRTYTIDSGTGNPAPSLKIEAGSPNIGIKWGGTAVLGKRYQATFSYKCGDAATTLAYRLNDADSFVNLDNSTSWATKTVEWTGDGVTGGFMLRVNESGKFGHFDTVSIKAIGCVSDYQTQWANPTQSLTVQDASGNADGTCSASGVTQVQPVVQLNSTSARIGTSAATPADGEVVADTVSVTGTGHDAAKITITNTASANARLLLNSGHGNWSVCNSDTVGDALEFRDESANATRLTINSTGDVTVNESLAIGTTPTSGISLNVREDSTTTAADIRNANASGFGLYVAGGSSSSEYSFRAANKDNNALFTVRGDGVAEFSNDVAFDDNARVYHGDLPSTGPSHSSHDKYNFNFTFSGTYGVALITLDIAAGIGEVAAGRYTLAISCTADSGVTTQLMGSVTEVFKHNLSALSFADSGSSNRTFTLSVERTVTLENWGSNTGSYKFEVTNNHRTLTLNSVTAST